MSLFRLRVSNFIFEPSLIPVIAASTLFLFLLILGFWQLDRAEQKRAIDQGVEAARQSTSLNLNTYSGNEFTSKIYQKTAVTGNFDSNHQLLLDNRTYKGKAGYHVLTPFLFTSFTLQGSKNKPLAVLINRGWITYKGDRKNIPDIRVSTNQETIKGTIKKISHSIILSSDNEASSTTLKYPKIIQTISLRKLSAELGYEFLPIIIELDKTEEYGFIRDWQPYYGSVDKHVAYAVQWFSMAAVLFILFIKVNTQKRKKTESRRHQYFHH